jgi:hypothetical protein
MTAPDPRLRTVLEERSHDIHVVGDLADRAIARDRSNRRREMTTAAAVGALALAVAVPIGWNAMRPVVPRPAPASTTGVAPPSSATVPTPSPSPTAIPTIRARGDAAPVVVDPAGREVAGSTSVAYVVEGVLHDGDRTVRLPDVGTVTLVARLADDGILVGGQVDYESVLFVLDADGKEVTRLPDVLTAFVSQDGTHFLASDTEGNLGYYDARGAKASGLSADSCDCVRDDGRGGYEAVGLIGTMAYATKKDTSGESVAWDVTSTRTTDIAARVDLVNAARQLLLVTPQGLREGQPCQELWDLSGARTLWHLCHPLRFTAFSRDGSHLLAHGMVDGLGHEWMSENGSFLYEPLVVIRTGDASVVLESKRATSFAMSTMDDGVTIQHLVDGDGSALSRCTLDGSCEVVAPAVRSNAGPYDPDTLPPYVLSNN